MGSLESCPDGRDESPNLHKHGRSRNAHPRRANPASGSRHFRVASLFADRCHVRYLSLVRASTQLVRLLKRFSIGIVLGMSVVPHFSEAEVAGTAPTGFATKAIDGVPGLFALENSPESDSAVITIIRPAPGQIFAEGDSVFLEFSVTGIALGVPTYHFERFASMNDPNGQHVHIVTDSDEFLTSYHAGVPVYLGLAKEGRHCAHVYACRSWHESIKSAGSRQFVEYVVKGEHAESGNQDTLTCPARLIVYCSEGFLSQDSVPVRLIDYVPLGFDLHAEELSIRIELGEVQKSGLGWTSHLCVGPLNSEIQLRVITREGTVYPGVQTLPMKSRK